MSEEVEALGEALPSLKMINYQGQSKTNDILHSTAVPL